MDLRRQIIASANECNKRARVEPHDKIFMIRCMRWNGTLNQLTKDSKEYQRLLNGYTELDPDFTHNPQIWHCPENKVLEIYGSLT